MEQVSGKNANCPIRPFFWQKPIVYQLISSGTDPETVSRIEQITIDALEDISEVTPITFSKYESIEPNFFIYVMSPEVVEYLDQPKTKSIGYYGDTLAKNMYRQDSCSGRIYYSDTPYTPNKKYQEIGAAAAFIYSDLAGLDLESCIYEEVAGIVGLANDPEGLPSLFSNGDFEVADGKFKYAQRTLAMFTAIYEIAAGKFKNIEEFCEAGSER